MVGSFIVSLQGIEEFRVRKVQACLIVDGCVGFRQPLFNQPRRHSRKCAFRCRADWA